MRKKLIPHRNLLLMLRFMNQIRIIKSISRKKLILIMNMRKRSINSITKSLLGTVRIITVGLFIGLLGKFSVGRWLLLKLPSVFSLGWFRKKGPTEDEVNNASFKMWFVGHGYIDSNMASSNMKPDTEIITRVVGPEIGYITTPIILIQCALIVLNQRGNLPKGGVFPPGIVFGPTDLQDRLQQNGISFDLVSERGLIS